MIADKDESGQAAGEALSQRVSARRRLLRGTFVVPTVLTLSSGAALASTSSLRCFVNSPAGVNAPPENYFRVQRYTHTSSEGTTQLVRASEITDLATLKGFSASLYTTGKTWIKVSDGLNFDIGTTNPVIDTNVYVALRFENAGTEALPNFRVSGLAASASSLQQTGAGNVMTHSCWASI